MTAPRFVAFVGVKDEAELIAANIAHLRRIGVQRIVIIDPGSTDGTLEVVDREGRQGDVTLVHIDDERDPHGSQRSIAMAREAGAEWALFLDADEFYLPVAGTLTTLSELDEADILTVETYNVALNRLGLQPDPGTWTPDNYDRIVVHARGPEPDRWPKVMARPEAVEDIIDGHHGALPVAGHHWRNMMSNDMMVAHVPLSTLPRYERKVANIRRYYERYPDWFADSRGSNWFRMLERDNEGRTREMFESWSLEPAQIERMRLDGTLCTAAEVLRTRRSVRA